jgi:hypothetical protein
VRCPQTEAQFSLRRIAESKSVEVPVANYPVPSGVSRALLLLFPDGKPFQLFLPEYFSKIIVLNDEND